MCLKGSGEIIYTNLVLLLIYMYVSVVYRENSKIGKINT